MHSLQVTQQFKNRCQQVVLMLPFMLVNVRGAKKLNIEILTYGFTNVHGQGPIWRFKVGMDHAVEELRNLYENTTNITHTYIFDQKSRNCMELLTEMDVMLSEWYYKHRAPADLHAIITPGKRLDSRHQKCQELLQLDSDWVNGVGRAQGNIFEDTANV